MRATSTSGPSDCHSRSQICTARSTVGAPAHLLLHAGTSDGELDDDDFPGRWFAAWEPDALVDVLIGAGFDVESCTVDADDPFWVETRIRAPARCPTPSVPACACSSAA